MPFCHDLEGFGRIPMSQRTPDHLAILYELLAVWSRTSVTEDSSPTNREYASSGEGENRHGRVGDDVVIKAERGLVWWS